ncbi:MAG TPA: M15 family metallopeptidase [Alphaproteobacteria bacterium]|nr:M15 family metallopeptidase [Alphaproteobacteria bacterium]
MTTQTALRPQPLPENFVYLQDIDPTILQEVRYALSHNFMGRPVTSYNSPIIIVTEAVALALKAVQEELKPFNLGLKVYDGYRPQDAVDAFAKWAEDPTDQLMKAEFYPNIDKKTLFEAGYIAKRSSHTRGSAVDLTIVPLPVPEQPTWEPGDPILDGRLPKDKRFPDNSIDMGTGFDCLDELSHTINPALPPEVRANRLLLKTLMEKHGFENYRKEWWHFGLRNERYPDTYFNFPVE